MIVALTSKDSGEKVAVNLAMVAYIEARGPEASAVVFGNGIPALLVEEWVEDILDAVGSEVTVRHPQSRGFHIDR